MAVDKAIKKKVIDDWKNAFPQLTLYSTNKFYKVVGSCLIGIELIKSPHAENYSPYFVMYSLCGNRIGNDIKACLSGPIVLQQYYNKKGFQYDIPYEKHSAYFADVLDSVKKQTPMPLEGNISFKEIATAIDESSKRPPLSAAPNSYLQAALQEAKLRIALFINIEEAQKVFDLISTRSWDVNHFKACGVDLSKWLQNIEEVMVNKDNFLKQIERNRGDEKLAKLKVSELVL